MDARKKNYRLVGLRINVAIVWCVLIAQHPFERSSNANQPDKKGMMAFGLIVRAAGSQELNDRE